jgi:hypothetical protein
MLGALAALAGATDDGGRVARAAHLGRPACLGRPAHSPDAASKGERDSEETWGHARLAETVTVKRREQSTQLIHPKISLPEVAGRR